MADNTARIRVIRLTSRVVLIALSLVWLLFALLSGAESGVEGILANLPNAAPWLGLLAIALIAWQRDGLGGWLAVVAGVAMTFFFNAWTSPIILLGLSLPVTLAGVALVSCHRVSIPDPANRR